MNAIKIGKRVFSDKELIDKGILKAAPQPVKTDKQIQREATAAEIDRIFGKTVIEFVDHELLDAVYKKTAGRCNLRWWGLAGVYLMGYMYGIRAERKRRKERAAHRDEDTIQ